MIPTIRSGAVCRVSTKAAVYAAAVFEYVYPDDDGSLTFVFRIDGRLEGIPLSSITAIRATTEAPETEGELREAFGL